MSNVVLNITSDENNSFKRVIEQSAKDIERLKAKIKEMNEGARDSGAQADGAMTSIVGTVGRWAAGLATVHTAYRLIGAEITQIQEAQSKAAREQITLAGAQRELKLNLVGSSQSEIQGVIGGASRIARRSGVDEATITRALAQAVSASGGRVPQAMEAVGLASRMFAHDPAAIPMQTGAMLDLAKITGSDDPSVNFGYLLAISARSRVVDPQRLAKNVAPAVISTVGLGASSREAAALFTSITSGMGDVTGEMSGTAMVQLQRQLVEAATGTKGFKGKRIAFPGEADTTEERIAFLQANQGMADRFLQTSSFEAKALGVIRAMLTDPNSFVAKEFREGMKLIGTPAELAGITGSMAGTLEGGPLERAARLERTFKVGTQQVQISDLIGGEGAINREGLASVLNAAGQSALGERIRGMAFDMTTDTGRSSALERTIQIIEQFQQQMMTVPWQFSGRNRGGESVGMLGAPFTEVIEQPGARGRVESAQNFQAVRILAEILAELRRARSGAPSLTAPNQETGRTLNSVR